MAHSFNNHIGLIYVELSTGNHHVIMTITLLFNSSDQIMYDS